MPASMRSYFKPSSSAVHSAFLTFTELTRPQIFNMLKAHRLPIAPRIARDEVAALERPDELRAAELVVVIEGHDAMAAALQLFQGRGRKTVFLNGDIHALDEAEARAVARRLRALTVVGNAHHDLRVPLRLHRAAHHAEAHHRSAVAGDKSRDDRLVGPLPRRDGVRMAGLEDEGGAAVL